MQRPIELNQITTDMLATTPDPYPIYDQLREEAPIYWSENMQGWLLTRYQDVWDVGKDTINFSAQQNWQGIFGEDLKELGPYTESLSRWMNFIDHPHHLPIRNLFSKHLFLDNVQTRVQTVAHQLADKLKQKGQTELVKEFSMPLFIAAINELINIPLEDWPQVIQWVEELSLASGYTDNYLEMLRQGQKSMLAMTEYCHKLISKSNPSPKGSLLQAVIDTNEAENITTDAQLCAQLVFIITSGVVTLPPFIGMGMLVLHQNPEELEKLRRHRASLIKSAVEELLRYENPAQTFRRTARTDIEMKGHHIRKGQTIVAILGAANRDPAVFSDPNRLDITRKPNKHLSFYAGSHGCIGASFVRLITQATFSVLLELPTLRVPEQKIAWVPNNMIARGLERLYVTC